MKSFFLGFNGHFSLVTPPQQHQESPGGVETGVNPAVTSTGQNMHQDSWQTSAWVSQAATSNCNLMDSQQYSLASGFATQSEAEIALSANGKCKFKAIQS